MPQDAPKTSPRCSKTPQDAPGTAQDRREAVPGRLQDAPRRPKTAPSWSPEARESAQDAARSEEKRGTKAIRSAIRSRSRFQSVFFGGFLSVFGWIWEGFGDDFGSLEVDFSTILGASPKPQETTRRHRKNSMPSASAASERAQRAKRAERLRCLSAYSSGFSGRFAETTEKNTTRRRSENNKTRFPFLYLDRFMLGVVYRAGESSKFMAFHSF